MNEIYINAVGKTSSLVSVYIVNNGKCLYQEKLKFCKYTGQYLAELYVLNYILLDTNIDFKDSIVYLQQESLVKVLNGVFSPIKYSNLVGNLIEYICDNLPNITIKHLHISEFNEVNSKNNSNTFDTNISFIDRVNYNKDFDMIRIIDKNYYRTLNQ